jgi:hypothetical protein
MTKNITYPKSHFFKLPIKPPRMKYFLLRKLIPISYSEY